MTSRHDDAVLQATWSWKEAPVEGPKRSVAGLAFRSLLPFVVAGLFAWGGHRWAAAIVATIGLCYLGLQLVVPGAAGRADRGMTRFGELVGAAVTWLLLVPLYLAVFSVSAVLLRLRGRDPLRRACDPNAESYWKDVSQSTTRVDYSRQS